MEMETNQIYIRYFLTIMEEKKVEVKNEEKSIFNKTLLLE